MFDTDYVKTVRVILAVCAVAGVLMGGGPGGEAMAQGNYLMAWGMNANGQAVLVSTNLLEDVDAIAAGWYHTIVAKEGRVWAWGDNSYGQTNIPIAAYQEVADVAAGKSFNLARKTDGTVLAWGGGATITNIPTAATGNVTQVAAGAWHALALTSDGGVVAWGSNTYGQTTVPAALTAGVDAVSAGEHYSLALKEGAVHVFGSSLHGIQNVPTEASTGVVAISAGAYHALALKTNGSVVAWGGTNFFDEADYLPAEAASGVATISAGYLFSMAVKTNGDLVVWGNLINGQTPVPSYAQHDVGMIAAGYGHCVAMCSVLPPRFIPENLPYGYISNAYSASVTALADPAATYHAVGNWHWLSISTDGQLSGTPLNDGSYPVKVVASNAYGQVTNDITVTVFDAPQEPPVFVTTSPLPSGTVGGYYELPIVASNVLTLSWENAGGGFPAGMTFTTNGLLSGTPTGPYNTFFYVLASNQTAVVTNAYNLTITNPIVAPVFVTENLPAGLVGQAYSNRIDISHYPTNILVSAGTLPSGLGLTSSGWITGMPVQVESRSFTVWAVNAAGANDQGYTLDIFGPPVFVTDSPLPAGGVGEAYSEQILATYAETFSHVAGTLPPGLTLVTNGLVSGMPTQVGAYNFTVRATNDYGWSNRVFDLTIGVLPAFMTTNPLPAGVVDEAYSTQILASDADGFILAGGSLPPGLTLATTGWITGIPSTYGDYLFTVRATNSYGGTNRDYDLVIGGQIPPRILAVRATNGAIRLEWTNYNASGSIAVLRATNITATEVNWSNLGTLTESPWTNAAPVPMPAYYKLHWLP